MPHNFLSTELAEKLKIERLLHKNWVKLSELHPAFHNDMRFYIDSEKIKNDGLDILIASSEINRWYNSRFLNGVWHEKPFFLPSGQLLESYVEVTDYYENGDIKKYNAQKSELRR